MRNLVVTEFISLDGVIEGPGGDGEYIHRGWTMPYWSDEIGAFKLDELMAGDAFLLGRITYQGFAAAWPGRTDEMGFADRMNNLPKYVVSTTLQQTSWKNSTILHEHIEAEVARLKAEPGQDILLPGSSLLVQSLVPSGLIDEFRLLVYPIVLGSGKRLFSQVDKTPLRLSESKAFANGVLLQRYLREAPAAA